MKGFIRTRGGEDGKPRYQADVKVDGGVRSLGTFKLKKDAEARLKRAEAEYASGMFGREELTFAEFGKKWIRDHAELKKPSTRDDYRGVVVHHLIPYFGRSKLVSRQLSIVG